MISSRRNPLVRRLKALASREGRETHALVLLEGTNLLKETLRIDLSPKEVIATSYWLSKNSSLMQLLPPETIVYEVTNSVLQASLTTVNPDGVAAVLPVEKLPRSYKNESFILALDRLQDPGNLGMLFRIALAGEIEAVWIASGADPLGTKALRASAGAVLNLPFDRFGFSEKEAVNELEKKLQLAKRLGWQVVATIVHEASVAQKVIPYWELDWSLPTVLVLGNEGSGLDLSVQACCTHSVTIPHSPLVESLNVAAAAVPLLLERRRAKMSSPMN